MSVVIDQGIERVDLRRPAAHRARRRHPLGQPAFLADRGAEPVGLVGDALRIADRTVEGFGDAAVGP
jgi:hypothetical protein